MKRLAWLTSVILAVLMGLLIVWQFRQAVGLFLISLALAAAVRPLVNRLVALGAPRNLALFLIYLAGLAVLFALIFEISEPLFTELQRAADNFVVAYDQIWAGWPQGTTFQQTVVKWLPPPAVLYESIGDDQGGTLLSRLLGVTANIFDVVSNSLIVLDLSLYWAVDQDHFERVWLSLLPVEYRARARNSWRSIETGVGAYLRSELVQSVLAGLLLGLGYGALGLPYPTLLAIVSAFVLLIPWLGAILATALVCGIGLSISPWLGLVVALYTLAIFGLLQWVVEPRLFNRQPYSSLLVVLLVIALGEIWGLAGVLVAPPLAVALQLAFNYFIQQSAASSATEISEKFDELEIRLQAVRTILAEAETAPTPQALSLVERLSELTRRAHATLQSDKSQPSRRVV
jgi:predicted PurR-regulated permease PerM